MMTVGEALTNLVFAKITNLKVRIHDSSDVLSKFSGRTQVLYKAHVLYCALLSRSCFFFSGNC